MDLGCKHECPLSEPDILLVHSGENVKDMKHQIYEGGQFQDLKPDQLDLNHNFFCCLCKSFIAEARCRVQYAALLHLNHSNSG